MLTANDLMTVNPLSVSPDTPLRNVVDIMHEEGYRHLPIVEDNKLVGIVTDRDVRIQLDSPVLHLDRINWAEEFAQMTAATCMTVNPITVAPDTSIKKVAKILSTYKFGALPVVDDGMLVGIISEVDLLAYLASLPVIN
jgi:acetoin utilization protein AcuB